MKILVFACSVILFSCMYPQASDNSLDQCRDEEKKIIQKFGDCLARCDIDLPISENPVQGTEADKCNIEVGRLRDVIRQCQCQVELS